VYARAQSLVETAVAGSGTGTHRRSHAL